jgi:cold shock CspA family protein
MQVPLEISFRDVEKTAGLESMIRRQAEKLERVAGRIVSCRIAVEKAQYHFTTGTPYRVRLDLRVPPGHELVIRREPGEGGPRDDLLKILLQVFGSARRRLQGLHQRQRGRTKTHAVVQENLGYVVRLFPRSGYGFLRSRDGREIYFHRHSLINEDFDRLDVGAAVRFVEENGRDGPQASTVQVVEPPMVRSKDVPKTLVPRPMGWV